MSHQIYHLLGSLEGYVTDLRSATDITREKFLRDIRSRRFVERTVHIAIECCFKVVQFIISEEGLRSPASCDDALTLLAEKGIIRRRSVPEYRMMAEFRDKVMKSIENADREQARRSAFFKTSWMSLRGLELKFRNFLKTEQIRGRMHERRSE